ncbi:hypothetical protein [Paenibacillus rigui]|uniref:STAS/SEC14 domain-containing protein n=1 Tax=Paenibacillus rigui TaxID=554312 RepID=A0A229URI1_9BACL|nr:hypothetical protein [Paenibacillus rigui]OXM85509.1 hypothetical protein CF651_15130 [Paenibacillus rigui]
MIYYESPQADVEWNETLNSVVVTWKGFAQGEKFQEPLNKALNLSKQKKAEKWLIDTRYASASTQNDQKWIAEQWHPNLMETGLRSLAIVKPNKTVANLSINRTISDLVISYAVEHFTTLDEASIWLLKRQAG